MAWKGWESSLLCSGKELSLVVLKRDWEWEMIQETLKNPQIIDKCLGNRKISTNGWTLLLASKARMVLLLDVNRLTAVGLCPLSMLLHSDHSSTWETPPMNEY